VLEVEHDKSTSADGLSQDHIVEQDNSTSAEGLSQDHLVKHDNSPSTEGLSRDDNSMSAEGLSQDHCLAALAAVRRALWFKVCIFHCYLFSFIHSFVFVY